MADDSATRSSAIPPPPQGNGGGPGSGASAGSSDFAALRRLLVGPEQHRLDELTRELHERELTTEALAERLPEAIVLRAKRDRQIGRALAPTVETALKESIRRNPREIAAAIFPVLGPAIRKAIAETMTSLVRSINSAVEHSFSPRGIRWRLESWRTGVPYAQVVIKNALLYRVEQAFLIHAESGLLLAHATAPGLLVPDADLISGMMTAIQDFVRDSFRPGKGATLRTFSVGEHTVQVEAGPHALLALVIQGHAPDAVLRRQQDVLEALHLQFGTALVEFSGDASAFVAARPMLEECLETVVDTGAQRQGRALWLRFTIPLGAVALALVFVAWRAGVRFERAVAAIEDEPGLVVIDADREWFRWRISGLRDPGARTPEAVLAGVGLAPRALIGRWEPYLSLDSAVIISRARRAWSLSPSAGLALRGDTLALTGDVPLPALRLLRTASLPAGASQVDVSGATVVLPPTLDSMRAALEGDRVLFGPGRAEVPASGRAAILAAATRFRALDDSLTAHGADVELRLVGRTDPTGTAETNQALAQWRVDHVAAIFASAGVRTQRIREEALATLRPLTAPDSAEQARINRSVSFEVAITAGSRLPREGMR